MSCDAAALATSLEEAEDRADMRACRARCARDRIPRQGQRSFAIVTPTKCSSVKRRLDVPRSRSNNRLAGCDCGRSHRHVMVLTGAALARLRRSRLESHWRGQRRRELLRPRPRFPQRTERKFPACFGGRLSNNLCVSFIWRTITQS